MYVNFRLPANVKMRAKSYLKSARFLYFKELVYQDMGKQFIWKVVPSREQNGGHVHLEGWFHSCKSRTYVVRIIGAPSTQLERFDSWICDGNSARWSSSLWCCCLVFSYPHVLLKSFSCVGIIAFVSLCSLFSLFVFALSYQSLCNLLRRARVQAT